MAFPTIFTIKGHFLNSKSVTDGELIFRLNWEYDINPGYVFYFLLKREVVGYTILSIISA